MDPIWAFIVNIATLVAIIVVGYFQRERIKTLEYSLTSQKSILDAVKSYFDIFKIDELKKYVALSEENSKKEASRQIEHIVHQMSSEMDKQLNRSIESTTDLYNLVYALLVRIPPKARLQLVSENLKTQGVKLLMLSYLTQTQDIYLPPPYLTMLDLFLSSVPAQKDSQSNPTLS